MWSFGGITVNGKVALGPMAGVTTIAYRQFMKRFGVSLLYTEMVSDCGIVYDSRHTKTYLDIGKHEHPIGVQLFGGKVETLTKAIVKLEAMGINYDFLDINLGCPMPKVTKTGAGASWLTRPEELEAMMKAVVATSHKPVSAKIRLGSDDSHINVEDIVHRLERAGVMMIAIHSRTTKQIYQGLARHEIIRAIGQRMTVPLIISGDIFSIDQAITALEITGATAVMVARGGLGRPRLIEQLHRYFLDGTKLPDATLREQLVYLRRYAKQLVALKGEDVAIRELRGIGVHFLTGYPGIKPFKAAMTTMATFADLDTIIHRVRLKIRAEKRHEDKQITA